MAKHGTKTTPECLTADGEASSLLLGRLTIRWHSATRKHLSRILNVTGQV